MPRELRVEVLHVVGPDEDDEGLVPELREVAASRYVLVCRAGGRPSWLDRIRAFVRRDPIEAVTVVADEAAEEGEELSLTVDETAIDGVYETVARD
ncbi:DUF7526 family protein [Halobaculum marinum]|uniref:Uncharacterized protein n=1 Tax=Halobaculum marinum TaxID=3031996 RepID=A0ABD5X5A1_9EURY|nr:hypothetical protein [Halobaculum sp. DT55]